MRRFVISVIIGCLFVPNIGVSQVNQSPYNFNWKRDVIYACGAGLVTAGGLLADLQTRPLTLAQINSLDPYEETGIDRQILDNWSPKADLASDVLLYSTFALPGLMMLNKRTRKDFLVVGFIYAETAMLTFGATQLLKAGVKRPRPFVYNPDVSINRKTAKDARYSFVSGHTSMATALCFTTAKIFCDYSDNPTHEALVWTAAAILPISIAALRIEAGKHFPSDVIGGYFLGGVIGYLVPWLHRRKPLTKGLTIAPVGFEKWGRIIF